MRLSRETPLHMHENKPDKLFSKTETHSSQLYLALQLLKLSHYLTDELATELWDLGTLGIIEGEHIITAFFDDGTNLTEVTSRYLAELSPCLLGPAETIGHLTPAEPVLAGTRFFITERSDTSSTPPGRIRLNIETSSAFGSGRHETTQLNLTALEKYLRPGSSLLDVGSGSGIVPAAAQALGAGTILACDIEDLSLELTRKSAPGALLYKGSVDAIASASVPLIVANIRASVINLLSPDLARISKPEGTLILSGFIQGQGPKDISPENILELNEWQCWICRPESIRLSSTFTDPVQPFSAVWW